MRFDPTPGDIVKRLASSGGFFSGVPDAKLLLLAKISNKRVVARGGQDKLWAKGTFGNIAFVWTGRLQVLRDGRVSGVVGPDETIGLSTFVPGRPHTADVVSAEGAKCLQWSGVEMSEVLDPEEVRQAPLREALRLIRKLNDELARWRHGGTEEVVCWHLEQLVGPQVAGVRRTEVDCSQAELGAAAGLSEFTVNRVLRKFRRRGAIGPSSRRRIIIQDLAKALGPEPSVVTDAQRGPEGEPGAAVRSADRASDLKRTQEVRVAARRESDRPEAKARRNGDDTGAE